MSLQQKLYLVCGLSVLRDKKKLGKTKLSDLVIIYQFTC